MPNSSRSSAAGPGDLPSTLRILVPRAVSAQSVADEVVAKLPIVRRQGDKGASTHLLSPPTQLRDIEIDFSGIETATASGICDLLALGEWLHLQSKSHADLRVHLKGIGPWTSADRVQGDSARYPSFLVAPQRLELPPYALSTSEEGDKARQSLVHWADHAAATIQSMAGPYEIPDVVLDCISTAITEGLLNVYEHAYFEQTTENSRSVWVCVSTQEIGDVSTEQGPLEQWLAGCVEKGGEKLVEVAITDIGIGIPATLGSEYRRQHPKVGLRRAHDLVRFHDDILQFAFSPYGSRKTASEFKEPRLRQMWRGLYKVQRRTAALDGLAAIRSGAGQYGVVYFEHRVARIRRSQYPGAARHRTLAGTALSVQIALPQALGARDGILRGAIEVADNVVRSESVGIEIPVALRPPCPILPTDDLAGYSTSLAEFLMATTETFGLLDERPARFALLKHPILHFGRVAGVASRAAFGDQEWTSIFGLFATCALPEFVPIHLGIKPPHGSLETAVEQFPDWMQPRDANAEENLPVIAGLHHAATSRIQWFVGGAGIPEADAVRLAQTRTLQSRDQIPSWWLRLRTLYPKIVDIVGTDASGFHLHLVVPDQLPPDVTKAHLGEVVRGLTKVGSKRPPWYWAASPTSREVLQTRSGRYVKEYISAYGMCEAEPCIEDAFVGALLRHLRTTTTAGHDTRRLIVPDGTHSSYLLAKRLIARLPVDGSLEPIVIHPDEVETSVAKGETVTIFADAVHSAHALSTQSARLNRLGISWSPFCCLDLRPESFKRTLEGVGLQSAIEWEFPGFTDTTLPPNPLVLTAENISNEILEPSEPTAAGRSLSTFGWSRGDQGAIRDNDRVLADRQDRIVRALARTKALHYGLQRGEGLYHVVRVSVRSLVEDKEFFDELLSWLTEIIGGETRKTSSASDIVIFCRDESVFASIREQIANILAARLPQNGWTGNIFTVIVPVARRGTRQIIDQRAKLLLSRAQFEAGWPTMDYRKGELDLAGGPPQVRTRFFGVFLDNATISARALRDFCSAMTELREGCLPASLLLCPLVSRLSPSEEGFILKARALASNYSAEATISLTFGALLQLRIGAFETLDAVPVVGRMRELVSRIESDSSYSTDILQWVQGAREKIEQIAARLNWVEQYPAYPEVLREERQVSSRAILLRQLFALHQQLAPVVPELSNLVRDCIREKDESLITVLAIEPQLCDEPLIARHFAPDIRKLVIEVLENPEATIPDKSNALWVLHAYPQDFADHQRTIAEYCLSEPILRGQWLAQLFASPLEAREVAITSALQKVLLVWRDERTRDNLKVYSSVVATLRLWSYPQTAALPTSPQTGKAAIYELLRQSRNRHGEEGFPAWANIIRLVRPAIDVEALKSERRWEACRRWMSNYLLPAFDAIGLLANAGLREGIEHLKSTRFEAMEAFAVAEFLASQGPISEFETAWNRVLASTLRAGVKDTYLDPSLVLGLTPPLNDAGYLDKTLPEIVQEPVGLLLHALHQRLPDDQRITLNITSIEQSQESSIRGTFAGEDERSVGLVTSLNRLWTELPQLPLVWQASSEMRLVVDILAQNIREHGDPEGEVVFDATFELSDRPRKGKLRLELRNTRRIGDRPGAGNGLKQVGEIIRRMGGVTTTPEPKGAAAFSICIEMPVSFLSVAQVGESQ